MPRGHRRSRHQPRALASGNENGGSEDGVIGERSERTVIFSKTKMCKFHILGMCSKGSACRFAHHKDELTALPDLSRTKLCKTLIATGSCEDPNCRYAHNKEELRQLPEGVLLFGDVPEGRLFRNSVARAAAANSSNNNIRRQEVMQGQPQLSALLEASQGQAAAPEPYAVRRPPHQPAQPPGEGPRAQPPPSRRKAAAVSEVSADEVAAGIPHPVFAQDSEEDPQSQIEPRMIVKNTFLDFETGKPAAKSWIRSNTWAASLCGLTEAEESSPASEAQASPHALRPAAEPSLAMPSTGCEFYLAEAAGKVLERLPEHKRTFCREVSNAASDASTEAPTDKRLQARDMLIMYGDAAVSAEGAGSSISSPPNEESVSGETSGDGGPGQAHPPQPGVQALAPTMQDPLASMMPVLGSGELIVKNTFLQFTEEDHVPLRAVRTAAGRLDLMG